MKRAVDIYIDRQTPALQTLQTGKQTDNHYRYTQTHDTTDMFTQDRKTHHTDRHYTLAHYSTETHTHTHTYRQYRRKDTTDIQTLHADSTYRQTDTTEKHTHRQILKNKDRHTIRKDTTDRHYR